MKSVHFVDTTIRDGNMSLWASGMRTDMILPMLADNDQAGFQAQEVIAENRFLAARDGVDATLIDPELETRVPVPEVLADLLAVCRPHAQDLGCEAELDSIEELVSNPPARRQIETARHVPSLGRLVERLSDRFSERRRGIRRLEVDAHAALGVTRHGTLLRGARPSIETGAERERAERRERRDERQRMDERVEQPKRARGIDVQHVTPPAPPADGSRVHRSTGRSCPPRSG